MIEARTRKILSLYKEGGMNSVIEYISNPNLKFEKDSWVLKVKNLIESNCIKSLEQEINLIIYKFNPIYGKEKSTGEDPELYSRNR